MSRPAAGGPDVWVVVPAGGLGTRMGRKKQDIRLGGRPLLRWTLDVFERAPEIAGVVVAVPAEDVGAWRRRLGGCRKVRAVVPGGRERQESVARGLAVGMAITASEYLTVQRARHRVREALRATYQKVEIIATPTTARVAPLLSEGVKGNGDDARHAGYNQSNLLRFPSMLGLPGCSLPCGMSPEGLPTGLQLIGSWFADQTVLNAAAAFQSVTDWHQLRPGIEKL